MPSSIDSSLSIHHDKIPGGTPSIELSDELFPPGPSRSSHHQIASPSPLRPSSLLHQRSHDGILDPSKSNVVTPVNDGSSNGPSSGSSSMPAAGVNGEGPRPASTGRPDQRRGTVSKGYKGRGRVPGETLEHGEEDDPLAERLLADVEAAGGFINTRDSWSREDSDGEDSPLRITIERPSTPQISSHSTLRPVLPPSAASYRGKTGPFAHLRTRLNVYIIQTGSLLVSSIFLGGVVMFALASRILFVTIPQFFRPPKPQSFPWDNPSKWAKEKVINDPTYYARNAGFDLQKITVESEDGFLLQLQKVVVRDAPVRSDGRGGFPVLIMHGLFQSSGSFITSEERSLAFWLAKEGGYQVYLGNTRGVFDMGHKSFKRSDPRFWDWTIRELAMYDLPALVDAVRSRTGYSKIGFIGHSQGNGTAFASLSLGIRPDLGPKLSCFVALAPAVFAGPLTHGFPFTVLGKMEWRTWRRFFGVLEFIPIMTFGYNWAPQAIFASLGYIMFSYLFDWTDRNWLMRRKQKMFRFTPSPVSSASIFWWAGKGGFASRKCLFDVGLDRWFDERFPPLSIYYGGRDYLVLTEPLLERLEKQEKDVRVIRVKKIDASEHCDFFWAAEAVEWCYHDILHDIESTRPRYPEEELELRRRDEHGSTGDLLGL